MIDFEEELKKFHPSLEVEQVEEKAYQAVQYLLQYGTGKGEGAESFRRRAGSAAQSGAE